MTINGTTVPTPSNITPSMNQLVDAKRDARGNMNIQRVNVKRKFEFSWNSLTMAEIQLFNNLFFESQFPSMALVFETKLSSSGTDFGNFYASDSSFSVQKITGGAYDVCTSFKCNLIEL